MQSKFNHELKEMMEVTEEREREKQTGMREKEMEDQTA